MKMMVRALVLATAMAMLAGCAIVPYDGYGYRLNSGIRGHFGPGYGYRGSFPGYGGYGGYGSFRPRWVPGYQRWVCEGPSSSPKCYWTWEPAHYE